MKKSLITIITICMLAAPACSFAAESFPVKLPYAKGQSFVVTQGYDTAPTHIKKDGYALDFTQNRCDAYGRTVVAAASGTVMFLSQEGYNGGYGTEVIINHGGNIVSRYAHMIPGSIAVASSGMPIRRGQMVGLVGDTGLVAGMACAAHPGTHLHFAMDTVNADGTFSAHDPEPISGYTNMTVGKWYLSDNDEDDGGNVSSASSVPVSPTAPPAQPQPNIITSGSSNVSVTVPEVTSVAPPPASISTSTTPIGAEDVSPAPTATDTTSGTLFTQPEDATLSTSSWYEDNWYELGDGFSGTLNALTLEGAVSDQLYSTSQVSLQEFKDAGYSALVQSFEISDDAPFTQTIATTTFAGLSIPLKPYFYYRLATFQAHQNSSVTLAGTTSTTAGLMMWNNFIYGAGRVEYTGPFFPFMVMQGVFATSTLTPPPITTPANLTATFDKLGMQLDFSWSTSTDPDWPANPLHYEMNYSTSTELSPTGWVPAGLIPVSMGNSYLIGIRAADNYGDISAVATTTWNFPSGFTSYLLSPGLSSAYQYFVVPSTSTLHSIEIFTTNFGTSARNPYTAGCDLQLFDEYNLSPVGMTPSDNGFNGYDCAGDLVFTFTSSSPTLYPDHRYHWVYSVSTGNPTTGAGVQFYGTATDTAGGVFSDSSIANAKFTVTGDSGVLFEN